jgi:hypothetical protein
MEGEAPMTRLLLAMLVAALPWLFVFAPVSMPLEWALVLLKSAAVVCVFMVSAMLFFTVYEGPQ